MNINDMPLISADLSESFLFPQFSFYSSAAQWITGLIWFHYYILRPSKAAHCYSQDVKDD